MGANDYFVQFDSNASDFSKGLETQLKGARNAVKLLRTDVTNLNHDLTALGRNKQALGLDAGKPSRTGAQPSIDTSKLMGQLDAASGEIANVLSGVEAVVGGMRRTANEIAEMPGKISEAVVSAIRSTEQHRRQAVGEGPHVDPNAKNPTRIATPGAGTTPIVSRDPAFVAAQAAAISAANRASQARIANVPKATIEQAGVDRIVRAIEKQTKVLKRGVETRPGADVPVTPATVTRGARTIDRAKIEAEARRLLATVGPVTEDAVKAAVDLAVGQAEAAAAALPAKLSKAERRAQAEAKRQNRPAISDEDLRLINSPGASGFGEGPRGGEYTIKKLHEMADAYERIGIAVQRTSKTNKADLTASLKGAFGEFSTLYPGGAKDFQVGKTTKIPEHTRELLGDIDKDLIEARQAAIALRHANTAGGGRNVQPNLDANGNPIHTKGQTYGAGVFPWEHAGSPVVRQGTPEELRATYGLLNSDAQREMARVRGQAQSNADYNPFDPSHSIQEGSTPAEKALADTARARLRDIRLAASELDKMGAEFRSLTDAMKRNEDFIERASARIGTQNEKSTDRDRLDQALTTVRDKYAADMEALTGRAQGFDFNDPSYLAGAQGRTADRTAFETAEKARAEATRNNESTYRDLRQALVEGVARVGDPKNRIPGLTYRQGELTASAGMSRQDFAELKRSVSHLASIEEDTLRARAGGYHASYADNITGRTPEQQSTLANLEKQFENAATRFAHRIEQIGGGKVRGTFEGHEISGGIAPTVEELIGRRPEQGRTLAEDELRRTAREAASNDAKNLTETAEQKQVRLGAEIIRAQERLRVAKEKAAAAAELLAREEEAAAAAFSGLTKAQQEEVLTQRKTAEEQQKVADLKRQELLDLEHNVKYRKYPPTAGDVNPEDPLMRGQAVEADQAHQAEVERLREEANLAQTAANHARTAAQQVGQERVEQGPSEQSLKDIARIEAQAKAAEKVIAAQQKIVAKDEAALAALPQATRRVGGVKVPLDTQGYDARLGYGPSVSSERSRINKEGAEARKAIADAQREIEAGVQRIKGLSATDVRYTGPEQGVRTSVGSAVTDADREVARAAAALADLEKQAKNAAGAEEQEAKAKAADTKATQEVVRATNAAITAKRAEIEALKRQGPHTKAELDPLLERRRAMAKDDPAYAQLDQDIRDLQARKTKKHQLQRELSALEGGGAGAGGRTTATGGADGDGSSNLLRQILAELRAIHRTVKGGVKVTEREPGTGKATKATTGTTGTTGTATAPAARRDAEALDRIAARRTQLRNKTADDLDAKVAEREVRDTQKQIDADNKEAAAKRNRARQAEVLKQALGLLNPKSQDEVETLRRLTAEAKGATTAEAKLAAETKVLAQQSKVAQTLNKDLNEQQIPSTGRRQVIKAVLNDAGPKLVPGEFEQVLRTASAGAGFTAMGTRWGEQMGTGAQDGFARVFGGGSSFWGRVLHTTGTFVVRNFAAGFVFGLTNMLQQVLDQAIQAETTFIRVRAALEAAGTELGDVRGDLQSIATDYGVPLNDVYTAAAGLVGLFDNAPDLASATRVVAQLQAISGGALNAAEATGVLASTLSAFQKQAGEEFDPSRFLPEDSLKATQRVADVLTSIQTTLGVNIETAAEGASSLAGLAREMKLSFEETAVYAGTIAKQTNQTGAAAGEQFGRIIGSINTGRGRAALLKAFDPRTAVTTTQKAVAAQVRGGLEQGDLGKVMQGLIKGWDGLSESQQRNLIVSIAGQRQARAFTALMNDSAKTQETLARAQDSTGQATERMDKIMETFQNRVHQLSSELQALAQNLIEAGIFDFLGLLLQGAKLLLHAVNLVLTSFNKITEANPALDLLKEILAVTLGLVAAFKLGGIAFRGLSGAISQFKPVVDPNAPAPATRPRYQFSATQSPTAGYAAHRLGYTGEQLNVRATERTAKITALREQGTAAALKEAKALERVNAVARTTSGALGGVSKGLGVLARAGLLLDAAMIGVTLGIVAITNTMAENREADKVSKAAADQLLASQRGASKTQLDLIAELTGVPPKLFKEAVRKLQEEQDRFFGQAHEEYYTGLEDKQKEGFISKGFTTAGAVFAQPKSWLSLSPFAGLSDAVGGISVQEAYQRQLGIDPKTGRPAGEVDTDKMLASATSQINASDTTDELKNLQKQLNDEIDAETLKVVNDGEISSKEREANLANLQKLQVLIDDQLGDALAVAKGAVSVGLNADDVSKIQELVSLRQTLGSSTVGQGIDFRPLLDTLQTGTGPGNDPGKLKKWIDGVINPQADTVDVLMLNRKILKESVKQLNEDFQVSYKDDPTSELTQTNFAELQTVIGQYAAANQGLFDAISQQADELATEFDAQNKPGEAMKTYSHAAWKAKKIFDQETRNIGQAWHQARRAWVAIMTQARRVAQLLGEDITGTPKFGEAGKKGLNAAAAERRRAFNVQQREKFDKAFERAVFQATKALSIQISNTVDAEKRAGLEAAKAAIVNGLTQAANRGEKIPGISKYLSSFGPGAITPQESLDAQTSANEAQLAAAQTEEDSGNTAAQNAAALRQARLGVAAAWADARGDAVAAARIQVAIAKATIAAARADLAAAKTADETVAARISILNAQAGLIAAMAAVQAAQQDLVQSQYDVSIALAEAAGHTVEAARRTLAAARAGLAAALRKSGGEATAEVNAARVQAIQAEAALRDARLQDDLDTIDFNLQMGKLTQASAIKALQEILRTRELTRDQRRQLLLQIKGMKDELSDSQWNFGDIKLPTPYQMRRYIEERKKQFRGELDHAAMGGSGGDTKPPDGDRPGGYGSQRSYTTTTTNIFKINGADIGMVRKVIKEVVGDTTAVNTRTTGARRGGVY